MDELRIFAQVWRLKKRVILNTFFFFPENQEEIGRENFSLGGPVELLPPVLEDTKSSKRFLATAAEEDERKLIGWLQVRDPNNRRKTFLQVVNPKPEGPFRKAPWHGNVHVMKF